MLGAFVLRMKQAPSRRLCAPLQQFVTVKLALSAKPSEICLELPKPLHRQFTNETTPPFDTNRYPTRTIAPGAAARRMVEVLRVDATGVFNLSMPVTQLRDESRLHTRELLVVEQPAIVMQPRILPRRHCIVLTMGYIRAIVWTDRVYLFNTGHKQVQQYARSLADYLKSAEQALSQPAVQSRRIEVDDGASGYSDDVASPSEVSSLSNRHDQLDPEVDDCIPGAAVGEESMLNAERTNATEETVPFEVLVLEHVLVASEARQAKRVAYARRVLEATLSKIEAVERDEGNLYALFPLANTLIHYEMISRGLMDCIRALLDDDRDMREACLTEKARISREIAHTAAEQARSHATAFDPTLTPDVVSRSSPLSSAYLMKQGISGTVRWKTENSEAFLGSASSPISSHRHTSHVLQSSDALNAIKKAGYTPDYYTPSSVNVPVPVPTENSASLQLQNYDLSEDANYKPTPMISPPDLPRLKWAYDEDTGESGSNSSERLPPVLRVSSDALSNLELMLESVYHRCAETTMHVQELAKSLKNKQDLLELQQSNHRNFILSVSLRMSIVTVAVSIGMSVTSMFGMNLYNGYEASKLAFPAVACVSIGIATYVYKWLGRATMKSSPTRKYAKRLHAFQDFLYKLDTKLDAAKDTLVAAGRSREDTSTGGFDRAIAWQGTSKTPNPLLSKADFRTLHKQTTGRDITDEELDLLFDLLDANNDGFLQLQEVVGMLEQRKIRTAGELHDAP